MYAQPLLIATYCAGLQATLELLLNNFIQYYKSNNFVYDLRLFVERKYLLIESFCIYYSYELLFAELSHG